ncbi:MAG: hypothetical protein SFV23_08320, partial [Planctomycetaceae bacterium]|nr:hypothetical protein [Planctomycetaceae bacterium]
MLILTDVVASTRLVSHLAEIVTHLGGEVVAVVCVVLVGPELVAEADAATDHTAALKLTSLNAPIPLFSLTDYRIQELRSEEFDEDKIIGV